ncbi:MAG: xylulokinase [Anaerolineae bacterium]|nr:xylulokinase [Anaerolineae bacterium]
MAVFIGIDLGTSSVKCAAIDDRGTQVAQAERTYDFDSPKAGWLEIHPDKWWKFTCAALAEVVSQIDANDVKALSVCGVMMMAVMLDEQGNPVRPTLSWLDQRVLPQLEWIKRNHYDEPMFAATGTALSPSQTVLPLLWVRENEPENFKRIRRVILSKDYLRYRLTGDIRTDFTDASATLLLDNRKGTWNLDVAELLGIPSAILPELAASAQPVGLITDAVAAEIGLPAGIPVVTGSGDGVSTILGLGIIRPGQVGITVGTAGVLMSTSPSFVADEQQRCLLFKHPIPDQWYLVTATNTSGEAARWYTNTVYGELDEAERYARFMSDAAASPPGARGVLFLPYLAGSRSPYYNAQARGSFFGLSLNHKLPDLARAVMEGVAYELKDCFEVHQENLVHEHTPVDEVRISGGIVRNPLWLQILADILELDLDVPQATELGVLGAAMNAAVGVRYYRDHAQAAAQMVTIVKTIHPDSRNHGVYAEGYALFKESYRSSLPLYRSLSEFVGRWSG